MTGVPEEVIIVEGRDDTKRLIETYGPTVKTIETNGSAVSRKVQDQIVAAAKTYGVIVLTDPDYQGDRIRRIVTDLVPQAKQAYLRADQASSGKIGKSLGVEHASPEVIRLAIASHMTPQQELGPQIPMADLVRLGLMGHPQASQRRDRVSQAFHLGKLNGKQLQKKLQLYHIGLDQLERLLENKEVGGR